MKNKRKNNLRLFLISTLLLFPLVAAAQDDLQKNGRALLEKHQDAVISVRFVIQQGMAYAGRQGTKHESKTEVTGTVLDDSGLAVVSLAAIDPTETFRKIMASAREGFADKEKYISEVKDVTMIWPDGKEVQAEVVLRDNDLDMAFVRPRQALAKAKSFIDLKEKSKPKILDPFFIVSRLGKVASREPAISQGHIAAIVHSPRTFYIPGTGSNVYGLGAPVFSQAGKPIGILLLRAIQVQGAMGFGGMAFSPNNANIITIVLPFGDVMKSMKQVPQRKKR